MIQYLCIPDREKKTLYGILIRLIRLLGLYSARMAFAQEGIFIVPQLLWDGASFFFGLIQKLSLSKV